MLYNGRRHFNNGQMNKFSGNSSNNNNNNHYHYNCNSINSYNDKTDSSSNNGSTIDNSSINSSNNDCGFDDALLKQVKFQIEYHFSDTNLSMDNYLLSRMHEDSEYWVPVKTVANLTKIRSLTENEATVLEAIKDSDMLILNSDETKVKRPSFVPPKPKQHKDLRRTVFLYGLSQDMANTESVIKLCNEFGKVKSVAFDIVSVHGSSSSRDFNFGNSDNKKDNNAQVEPVSQDKKTQNESQQRKPEEGSQDGPDRDVALVLMTKRFGGRLIRQSSINNVNGNNVANVGTIGTPNVGSNATSNMQMSNEILNGIVPPSPSPLYTHPIANPNGNPLDFSHLRSCFVVFESQVQFESF